LLTEKEVARSWGRIFQNSKVEAVSFERAEQLLEELRSESPLRHRLHLELEELRKLYTKQLSVVQNA
jgi:predicted DNA-binding WGR domain protein